MPPPKDQKELKSFLASTNVVRSHIENYNDLTAPLSLLLKKSSIWKWTISEELSFNSLKSAMVSPHVLATFSSTAPSRLNTDFNGFKFPQMGRSLEGLPPVRAFGSNSPPPTGCRLVTPRASSLQQKSTSFRNCLPLAV
jgi:hypothetical protein